MRKINFIVAMLLFIGATAMAQTTAKNFKADDYASFGEKFKVNRVYNKAEMLKKYKKLKKAIRLRFSSNRISNPYAKRKAAG
ncbi:MAG: hypothetical protein M0D53_15275 [Flavobacterium sp. JAD_PAG50586_2]|nr:MAG: hypothetical protein M0D53_15275 [Flavobacterium sp. JAD_PAG50586_2]